MFWRTVVMQVDLLIEPMPFWISAYSFSSSAGWPCAISRLCYWWPCSGWSPNTFLYWLSNFWYKFISFHSFSVLRSKFSFPDALLSHWQERLNCKDQKISENFYARGDGTVSLQHILIHHYFFFQLMRLIMITLSFCRGLSTSLANSWQAYSKKMVLMLRKSVCAANKLRTGRGSWWWIGKDSYFSRFWSF